MTVGVSYFQIKKTETKAAKYIKGFPVMQNHRLPHGNKFRHINYTSWDSQNTKSVVSLFH